eukprot:GEMP01079759.1.p2 GENE.GEMP01079759.1~~GEMP01079759.1.p2  ORF type:complete len:105 (+),score=2.37 GEMP01079759.1:410-724(+)
MGLKGQRSMVVAKISTNHQLFFVGALKNICGGEVPTLLFSTDEARNKKKTLNMSTRFCLYFTTYDCGTTSLKYNIVLFLSTETYGDNNPLIPHKNDCVDFLKRS